jgi:hypothetical protein
MKENEVVARDIKIYRMAYGKDQKIVILLLLAGLLCKPKRDDDDKLALHRIPSSLAHSRPSNNNK